MNRVHGRCEGGCQRNAKGEVNEVAKGNVKEALKGNAEGDTRPSSHHPYPPPSQPLLHPFHTSSHLLRILAWLAAALCPLACEAAVLGPLAWLT